MPSLVRRQWRLLLLYLMVLSVLRRNHWGMGLFCLSLTASVRLVRKVLWDGCGAGRKGAGGGGGEGEGREGECKSLEERHMAATSAAGPRVAWRVRRAR